MARPDIPAPIMITWVKVSVVDADIMFEKANKTVHSSIWV